MENDRNLAATKGDIDDLRLEMREEMRRMNEWHEMLRSEIGHQFHALTEAFRDGQTELLRAFYSYRETTDLKLKDAEVSDSLLRQRMTALENRQGNLEKRMDLPPTSLPPTT